MSKVSVWLGPPVIHNRMQEPLRCLLSAVSAAMVSSQPDIVPTVTPAAVIRNHSRRLSRLS